LSSAAAIAAYEEKIVNPEDHKWKVMACSFIAYSFDIADFMAIALAIPMLIKQWNLSLPVAGMLATMTLIGSAIGAYMWGPIMDKYGRKPAYLVCMTWFTLFTVFSGFCNNTTSLYIVRLIAGMGLGGAWILGNTLVSEFFPSHMRAKATGLLQTSGSFGYGFMVLVNMYLVPHLTPDQGWRALFWVAGLCFLNVIWMYFAIPESPVWLKMKIQQLSQGEKTSVAQEQHAIHAKPMDIFKPQYLRSTVFTALLAVSVVMAYWGAGNWIPTFLLAEKGFKLSAMNGYLLWLLGGSVLGYQFFGWLADKIGRRNSFFIGSASAAIIFFVMAYATTPDNYQVIAFLYGFITFGYWAPMGAFITENFPTQIRGTGTAFAWGCARVGAALGPISLGSLATITSLQFCIYLMAGVALTGLIWTYFLKETKGQSA